MRKETSSTLLVFSTAIALLLLASPLLLSNTLLLQPAQAQTTMTFRTPEPADGEIPGPPEDEPATLTFDVQGPASSSDPQTANITGGTIQLETTNDGTIYNGKVLEGTFTNDSRHGAFLNIDATFQPFGLNIQSACSTAELNPIYVSFSGSPSSTFNGPVECSSSSQGGGAGGGNTAPSSSSSTTGTTTSQSGDSNSRDGDGDSDSDGIPDSSDNCPHNSHHRCFKEGGDTSTTTTTQQQQPSTSMGGNQTR